MNIDITSDFPDGSTGTRCFDTTEINYVFEKKEYPPTRYFVKVLSGEIFPITKTEYARLAEHGVSKTETTIIHRSVCNPIMELEL